MDPDVLLREVIEDLDTLHRRIVHGLAKQEETRQTVAALSAQLSDLLMWRQKQGF